MGTEIKTSRLRLKNLGWKVFAHKAKRTLLGAAALFALTASIVAPSAATDNVSATGGVSNAPYLGNKPIFNFLGPDPNDPDNDGDEEMLVMANLGPEVPANTDPKETPKADWGDPVSGVKIGDRIAFLIYFHNGVPNTVAENTSVMVNLPLEPKTQINVKSYLWAKGVAAIEDTVVPGLGLIGQPGGTLNLTTPGVLKVNPASTKLLTRKPENLSQFNITALPDGIEQTGISIGNVKGCWEYSGFVYFIATVTPPANLVMDKHVARTTDKDWQKEVGVNPGEVNPGDVVEYRLAVRNDGGTVAKNVVVKDELPPQMEPVPGTLRIWDVNANVIGTTGDIYGAGVALPDVQPGAAGALFVTYRTKIKTLPAGWSHLVNHAYLFENGVEKDNDKAYVHVFVALPGLVVDKNVVTAAGLSKKATANLGDIVTYQIDLANNGNINLTNVSLTDVLPLHTDVVPGSITITGIALPGGVSADQIFSSTGLTLGNLTPGMAVKVNFQVKVVGCPDKGEEILNSAFARADSIVTPASTAAIVVSIPQLVKPVTVLF